MTVYDIIDKKEQEVERLTREIEALRAAARMLEESRAADAGNVPANVEAVAGETKNAQKKLQRFP